MDVIVQSVVFNGREHEVDTSLSIHVLLLRQLVSILKFLSRSGKHLEPLLKNYADVRHHLIGLWISERNFLIGIEVPHDGEFFSIVDFHLVECGTVRVASEFGLLLVSIVA